MNRITSIGMALALACACGAAQANDGDNLLTNPGFETPDPVFSFVPLGWSDIPLDTPLWATSPTRTGSRSIGFNAINGFVGWSTNIFDENGDLYDPPYVFRGGDLIVSGYFNIPTGQELSSNPDGPPNDTVGIKLEFRRIPPNFSIYQAMEFTIPVSGTDGEWQYFEIVVPGSALGDFCGQPEGEPCDVDSPERPGSVTILPFRFAGAGANPQGTIYWDDLCVVQESDEVCAADQNGDGSFNNTDINLFVNNFLAQDAAADINGDGSWNNTDINLFVNLFLTQCM